MDAKTEKTPAPTKTRRKKVLTPGKEKEKIELDIVVDSVYNMFKFKRSGNQGAIPKELSGFYTMRSKAEKALEAYLYKRRKA